MNKVCILRITLMVLSCLFVSIILLIPSISLRLNGNMENQELQNSIFYMLPFIGMLLVMAFFNKKFKLALFNINDKPIKSKALFEAIALGIMWQAFTYLIFRLQGEYPHAKSIPSIPIVILNIIGSCIVCPFAEELLFRKAIVDIMLKGTFKKVTIILVSSILFFCGHFSDSIIRIDTFLFAIPLCLMYMKYKDIRYCFVTHMVDSLLAIGLSYTLTII